MCLCVTLPLDLDPYKQWHCDSHISVTEWDSFAAQGCDGLIPEVTLVQGGICSTDHPGCYGRYEMKTFIANCRNEDHRDGKELQEEAMRGISSSHSCAPFPDRERSPPRTGKCNMYFSSRHTPPCSSGCNLHMNAVVFFISKNYENKSVQEVRGRERYEGGEGGK